MHVWISVYGNEPNLGQKTEFLFCVCRSPTISTTPPDKVTGRDKSQSVSPSKHRSPLKRKSPKKVVSKKTHHVLKVKMTPPKKTYASPSRVIATGKKHKSAGSDTEGSTLSSSLPKPPISKKQV